MACMIILKTKLLWHGQINPVHVLVLSTSLHHPRHPLVLGRLPARVRVWFAHAGVILPLKHS